MQASVLTQFGGPEVLRFGEMPSPVPAPDQVLIKVLACGVCGHDLLNRAGFFPHTKLPSVIGHEIAGVVVEAGSLVKYLKEGDRVAVVQRIPCGNCYLCREGRENLCASGPGFYGEDISGGYGEFIIASERNTIVLPDTVSNDVAAVMSCAIGTGYHALKRARLNIGDSIIITAASGGVGIHTVKLARQMGLKVIAISSSANKALRLKEAGADEVIISPSLQFYQQVRDITCGDGVDAIIEIAGDPTFQSSIKCLKKAGRMVLVGNVKPGGVELNPALSILKEIEIIGSAHATLSDLDTILQLVKEGKIEPEIFEALPFNEAEKAHQIMQERNSVGRVVLVNEIA